MAVYVSELKEITPGKHFTFNRGCTLFGDTTEELICFAEKLGLKPAWVRRPPQSKIGVDHFLLSPKNRRIALQYGAISLEQLSANQRAALFSKIVYRNEEEAVAAEE